MRRVTRARGMWPFVMSVALLLLLAGGVAGAGHARSATRPGMLMAGTSGPAAAGRAVPGAADTRCVFLSDDTCASVDTAVTVDSTSEGDTSACTFTVTIDWGDGTPPTSVSFAGGPDGSVTDAGDHTYTTPGNYTITGTGVVDSGQCTFNGGTLYFTLTSLITSPAAGSLVPMTDPAYLSPQPADTERAPANRDLTVTGVDNCGCAITVNGVAATSDGTTWQAKLPVTGPGPLTVRVETAAGEHDAAGLTLIDLRVASPAENAREPLTAAPAMPELDASPEIAGLPAGQDPSGIVFHWTLQTINRYVVPANTWVDDVRKAATGTTTGTTATWKLPASTPVTGGWGRLTVTASIPGATEPVVTSEPRWIDIPGTNPGKAEIAAYLAGQAGSYADVLTHIACKESGATFFQFRPAAQPLQIRWHGKLVDVDATSEKIPDGWPNPAPLRPLFGYPSGVGVMQLDPASFPAQQWDWQANVRGGIQLFLNEKLPRAAAWPGKRQVALNQVRAEDLARVNAARKARKLPPLTDAPQITVARYTPAELADDAIRAYNGYGGGHQFVWGQQYQISDGGLGLAVTGHPAWDKNTAIPKADNPDYVAEVWACG